MKQFNRQEPDYSEYDVEGEKKLLRNFLNENNLWVPENFYENLRPGDVIDLYTNPPQLNQLYGNSQFRKLCSYTTEQMKTIPFPKLFYREDDIQVRFIKKVSQAAFNEKDAIPWDIENHDLVETLHPNKRTFEVDLGRVAPCFKKETNERYGVIGSFRVNFIFEWSRG